MIEDKDKTLYEEIQSKPNPGHALPLSLSFLSLWADKGSVDTHYIEKWIYNQTLITITIKELILFAIHDKGF